MLRAIVVLPCLWLCVCAAHAQQPTADSAREDITRTYGFDPSKMSFDEQAKRAPTLSALWDRYDKAPQAYGAALRAALAADGATEMLYCDGGMLLLAKSKQAADQALGLKSIEKCSLSEIQHTPYFYTLHALAMRGVDTFDLQSKMLGKPKYSVFVVPHALRLGQNYAYTYPLLVQEESRYVPRLVERLKAEQDATARSTLLRALFYAATPQAEKELRTQATAQSSPAEIRAEAKKLVEQIDWVRAKSANDADLSKIRKLVAATTGATETELRTKRRARMRSISDEALYELEAYTALLYRTFKPA
ncbi:MAG TPA: hypothetical protein VHP37_01340 [Burkholderiales bacterium]|nr:hypothetical protein [Burkholderiales bacterium]